MNPEGPTSLRERAEANQSAQKTDLGMSPLHWRDPTSGDAQSRIEILQHNAVTGDLRTPAIKEPDTAAPREQSVRDRDQDMRIAAAVARVIASAPPISASRLQQISMLFRTHDARSRRAPAASS